MQSFSTFLYNAENARFSGGKFWGFGIRKLSHHGSALAGGRKGVHRNRCGQARIGAYFRRRPERSLYIAVARRSIEIQRQSYVFPDRKIRRSAAGYCAGGG